MYEHLNLKAWPFQIVPDAEFATIWAGRTRSKEQLKRLLWKMQFAPTSSIHLLWANFGMGKTHALYHLQHLCKQTKGRLIPVYAVMPKKASGFLEFYRAIVTELPYDFLGEQLVKVGNSTGGSSVTQHPMFRKSPGVVNALLALRKDDIERATAARQWLAAQPGLSNTDLRSVGVTYRIKTAEDATNALTALTHLATFRSNPPSKLVVMVDEFQRVGELRVSVRQELFSGIHTYYNENPNGLDLILSFSFGLQENVSFLLSPELKSRAEPESLSLDLLTESEAEEFIHDLLDQFRVSPPKNWSFPFTLEAIHTVTSHIKRTKTLTPRRLMLYFNHVLLESQFANGPDSAQEINAQEVMRYLADPKLGTMDADSVD